MMWLYWLLSIARLLFIHSTLERNLSFIWYIEGVYVIFLKVAAGCQRLSWFNKGLIGENGFGDMLESEALWWRVVCTKFGSMLGDWCSDGGYRNVWCKYLEVQGQDGINLLASLVLRWGDGTWINFGMIPGVGGSRWGKGFLYYFR